MLHQFWIFFLFHIFARILHPVLCFQIFSDANNDFIGVLLHGTLWLIMWTLCCTVLSVLGRWNNDNFGKTAAPLFIVLYVIFLFTMTLKNKNFNSNLKNNFLRNPGGTFSNPRILSTFAFYSLFDFISVCETNWKWTDLNAILWNIYTQKTKKFIGRLHI